MYITTINAKGGRLNKSKMTCNKPKSTPGHTTKSHVVKACESGKEKIVRFGQQGVKGAGKNPKSAKQKARKKSYYARHNAQGKPKSKFSAKYWSHKVKWAEGGKMKHSESETKTELFLPMGLSYSSRLQALLFHVLKK